MSSPHFYQGYPELWQSINGLKPEESLHETYLSIEPVSGWFAKQTIIIDYDAQHIVHVVVEEGFT